MPRPRRIPRDPEDPGVPPPTPPPPPPIPLHGVLSMETLAGAWRLNLAKFTLQSRPGWSLLGWTWPSSPSRLGLAGAWGDELGQVHPQVSSWLGPGGVNLAKFTLQPRPGWSLAGWTWSSSPSSVDLAGAWGGEPGQVYLPASPWHTFPPNFWEVLVHIYKNQGDVSQRRLRSIRIKKNQAGVSQRRLRSIRIKGACLRGGSDL